MLWYILCDFENLTLTNQIALFFYSSTLITNVSPCINICLLAVGKAACHAIGNLCKLDGQIVRAYGGKERRLASQGKEEVDTMHEKSSTDRDKSVYGNRPMPSSTQRSQGGGGGGGFSSQMNKNLQVGTRKSHDTICSNEYKSYVQTC